MTTALVSLASEITHEHAAACQAAQSALSHARRAGELLMQAKAGLEHGAWLPWLAEHCPTLPERTAQAYMRLAGRWPALEAKAQRVADLPVRDALALLAERGASDEESDGDASASVEVLAMLDRFDRLTGLIRGLVWMAQRSKPVGVRRRAARELDHLLRDMDKIGWGDDARVLVTYCQSMPEFGRQQGAAMMHRATDARIAELEVARGTD